MPTSSDLLEHTAPDDRYFNYCWWPYTPVAPTAGKLRPVGLLFHSFAVAGIDDRAVRVVRALQQELGLFRTVWGVKRAGDRLGWEFYFYDYGRRERAVSVGRVLAAVRPFVRCPVVVNDSLPYFMFSLDIADDLVTGGRELDVVHVYIGNPGSAVSSGIAYGFRPAGATLENFYFFFDAKRDLAEAAAKVLCSAHVDGTRWDIDRVLWPQLRDCHTICVANKPGCDTVYFSGVTVDQLLFFLRALRYPPAVVGFVEANRGKLDHLLYDVGFDYTTRGDDLWVVKSGYYGTF